MKKSTSVKIFLSFFMILILSLTGFSKEKKINSNWLNTKLNIDGLSGDWENVAISFEKKLGIDYAFRNDAENLFVLFVFKDPKYLSSIFSTGMTIWFNTEGKKKKNYGITFTNQRVSADAYISYLEQKSGPIPEEEKKKMRANRFYSFYLANVINKKSKSSSQSSESGGRKLAIFRSKSQNKMMVYEFAIPLERLTENAPGIGTEPGKTIKIGFEWGGMTEEMKKRRLQRQAASGGRATGAADSWYRDSTSGSVPRQSKSPKKHSFWVDVQLAQNK